MTTKKCGRETEVYSRVCGYHRPVSNWNKGKREEFKERRVYEIRKPYIPLIDRLSPEKRQELKSKMDELKAKKESR